MREERDIEKVREERDIEKVREEREKERKKKERECKAPENHRPTHEHISTRAHLGHLEDLVVIYSLRFFQFQLCLLQCLDDFWVHGETINGWQAKCNGISGGTTSRINIVPRLLGSNSFKVL